MNCNAKWGSERETDKREKNEETSGEEEKYVKLQKEFVGEKSGKGKNITSERMERETTEEDRREKREEEETEENTKKIEKWMLTSTFEDTKNDKGRPEWERMTDDRIEERRWDIWDRRMRIGYIIKEKRSKIIIITIQ